MVYVPWGAFVVFLFRQHEKNAFLRPFVLPLRKNSYWNCVTYSKYEILMLLNILQTKNWSDFVYTVNLKHTASTRRSSIDTCCQLNILLGTWDPTQHGLVLVLHEFVSVVNWIFFQVLCADLTVRGWSHLLVHAFLNNLRLLCASTWHPIQFTLLGGLNVKVGKIWCLGLLNLSGRNCCEVKLFEGAAARCAWEMIKWLLQRRDQRKRLPEPVCCLAQLWLLQVEQFST